MLFATSPRRNVFVSFTLSSLVSLCSFVIFLFFFQYFLACPCTAVPYSPYVLSLRFPDPSFSLSSSFCREVRRFIACVLPANRLAGKGEQDERNEREARTLFSNPLLSLIRQSFSFSLYSPQKLSSFSFPPLFRRGLLLSLLLSFQDLIESILRDVFGIPFLASSVFVEKCVSAEKKTVSVCLRAPIRKCCESSNLCECARTSVCARAHMHSCTT